MPWPGRSCPASSTGGTSTVWPGCCPAGGSPWAGRPTRRACASPTVLVDVPEGSPVLEEEIFGPILPVLLYRSLPELVEAQRQKPRPLALYLFTRSRSVERAVLEALPFGGGCVNDTVVHLADPRLPFGGVGNSGMGACHGKAGFDAFTHEKSVLKKGRLDIPVRYPPYGKKHLGILKKLM
ncbi:MAG: aldehyde dehydrogenase family protein [Flavonifractor plautii]